MSIYLRFVSREERKKGRGKEWTERGGEREGGDLVRED